MSEKLFGKPVNLEFNALGLVLIHRMKASGGTLSSSNIIGYDLTKAETHQMTIPATYAPRGWFNGTLSYLDVDGESVTFTAGVTQTTKRRRHLPQ